jgi:hypothetical protein
MHARQFATLEVLNYYHTAPAAPAGHSELEPLNLAEENIAQIITFLKALDARSTQSHVAWRGLNKKLSFHQPPQRLPQNLHRLPIFVE